MVVPMHLGAMHPFEQALTLVLAFGPFLALGIVIVVRRRADDRAELEAQAAQESTRAEGQRER